MALRLRGAATLLRRRFLATAACLTAAGALFASGGGPVTASDVTLLLYLVAVIVPLVHAAGSVSSDFRSGAAVLWLQKPVSPGAHYLGRLAEVIGASVAWLAIAAAFLAWHRPELLALGLHAPFALVTAVTVSAVGFGVSSLGLRPEALISLGVVYGLGMLGADAAAAPELFGRWAPLLSAQRFPFHELQTLYAWSAGSAGAPTRAAWLRVVLYPAAWMLLGVWAVNRRAGRLGRGDASR